MRFASSSTADSPSKGVLCHYALNEDVFTDVAADTAISNVRGGFQKAGRASETQTDTIEWLPVFEEVWVSTPKPSTRAQFTAGRESGSDFASFAKSLKREVQIVQQTEALKLLKPNWDGYGAPPLKQHVLDVLAKEVIEALRGTFRSAPELVPGADGSVQAEWNSVAHEVSYNLNETGERFFWSLDRNTRLQEWSFGAEAKLALAKWARSLR